ncbi:MAG: hypothetical protein ABGY75_09605, partial [Gemmataceae bacterium]
MIAVSGIGWGQAQLSPDGKRVAFSRQGAVVNMPRPKNAPAGAAVTTKRNTLQILTLDGKGDLKELPDVHLITWHWMDGGQKLFIRGREIGDGDVVSEKLENWVYDLTTSRKTPLTVPEHFVVRAVGPDGKTAIVDELKHTADTWHQRAHLWTIGSTDKPDPLLDLNHSFDVARPVFSPDGKKLLCKVSYHAKHTPQGNGRWTPEDFRFCNLLVIDLATKKQTVLKELGKESVWGIGGGAWSPDGKRIAYVECKTMPELWQELKKMSLRVMVADADGTNEKKIYEAEGSWLVGFDWK